ncbi:hypothetical protein LXL04_015282 [Taraxacum kok-saghyz]
MEVANEIAKGVVQVLMVPVKKQLDYVISHKKYLEDMHKKMKDLDAKKVGVESQKKQNRERRLEVPAQVSPWLEEVEQMNAKVADFPSEVPGCLDLKSRHKLGSKASKIIKEINSVLGRCPEIRGTELQIPLGRIDSTIGSTSTPSSDRSDFRSREHTFTKALEALGPNHSSHMVALWGMGGVGKTTMMKKLKEVVVEKKMFDHYVEAVIGEKTDPIAIQRDVAEYLGIDLTQTSKSARTDKLRTWFVNNSDGGKKKFLVILDDVWQPVDMEDIGLSRLPNQGIDFKVLMTSRNKDVCTEMGVKVDSILNVGCLTDSEAQSLFLQLWEPSHDVDADLYNIGEQIVRKCCGLPIAIKTMACTLRGKSKDAWKDALYRFQHHGNINKVAPTVFKTSYDNLQDEVIEETFLLCGLFPEDFNIPTEDLLRYGWGLKLFRGLDTIREARYRLNTCIERLMHTNLLIESNVLGCVKMHDLVRDFVLDMFSKDAHAAIVNHGSKRSWPKNDMSASCKRISLTCVDMAEFPSDLKFPNLTVLKLMHGDESLRFPQGFYGKMEKLLVISYDRMKILPSSLVCCTNLRVLRLDKCSVRFDLSCIGNLSNLEVLNFANCGVKRLPSIIGNLKKLRVLDVTGCGGLRMDNDFFKKLVSLEELYACAFDSSRNAISFIGDNYNEVAERWRNISALEYEFFKEKAQLMNLSFENLERFRISVECSIGIESKHSFENRLKLVMKKGELVGSRINELFEKTIILSLSVVDMNDLEDVSVKSLLRPQPSSFRNIRVLVVSECAELRYIFTHSVANAMSNLEDLHVFDCLVMKELIHVESGEEGRITFPNLKSLKLRRLPKLLGLCQNANIIALPQLVELEIEGLPNIKSIYSKNKLAVDCFLREEVLIPILEYLSVTGMDNLKEIWPCEFRMSEEVKLREIRVERCDKLVNLFPCNPLPLLHHLEELHVTECGSIEVLFNLDLACVGVIEKGSISSLRIIYVEDSGKLREVWKIKGGENNFGLPIRGFQAVERIRIFRCERFTFLFTPTTTNFDIGALIHLDINTMTNNGSVESSPQEIKLLSNEGTSEVSDSISYNLFPSSVLHCFQNLRTLLLSSHHEVDVIFEIESTPKSQDNQKRLFPHLEELEIEYMERLSHIWNCNWNTFLNTQKQHPESSFHNLTTIVMYNCKSIKYLFSPFMARLLSNLKTVKISRCDGIEEVVSHIDDEEEKTASTSIHTSSALFPHLDSLTLYVLENLKCIGGGGVAKDGKNEMSLNKTTTNATFLDPFKISQVDGVWWTLCQYPRKIRLVDCQSLSHIIPCYAVGQMIKLQKLNIYSCDGMREVFETERINKSVSMLKLTNLKILKIVGCDLLENIFTFSTLETLGQLEKLKIEFCNSMKVIVKEEEEDASSSSSKAVVFPRLKFITLFKLPELVGFFIGTNEFQWPALDVLKIDHCPKMKAFTAGGSTAPQLKYVATRLSKHSPECWFKSHVTNTSAVLHQETPFPSLESSSSEEIGIWSFHNLIEIKVKDDQSVEKIIPSRELLKLQKLETIHVESCSSAVEVFEAFEAGNDSQTTLVKLPNLIEVRLDGLPRLRYIWKSNQWTVFLFPNLTRLFIPKCHRLEHVFSSSMVGSLLQLQELRIIKCEDMDEVFFGDGNIVANEEEQEKESDGKMNEIVFPLLKSLTLEGLSHLKGFCLGKEDFSFPLLDTLTIQKCPAMTTFTTGYSSTPELKEVETEFGMYDVEKDINTLIKTTQEVDILKVHL